MTQQGRRDLDRVASICQVEEKKKQKKKTCFKIFVSTEEETWTLNWTKNKGGKPFFIIFFYDIIFSKKKKGFFNFFFFFLENHVIAR